MLIVPAIDLRGGRCVRLRQGDYAQETVFSDDPAATARQWADQGAVLVHVVDLDGARTGKPVNGEAIRAIVESVDVVQLGGGIRDEWAIEWALDLGVQRMVIGTKALKEPEWFAAMTRKYPSLLVLGLDAREGRVATDGWLLLSECRAIDLARRCEDLPLAGIVYTDISKDGMLEGPNLDALAELASAVTHSVYASGGVTTLDDIRRLAQLPIEGCIIGRALYERTIDLREAIDLVCGG